METGTELEAHKIGDYWYGIVDWQWTWLVKTRTGTFTLHCQADAVQSAQYAKKELARYNRQQKQSFQQKIEAIMDDMLAFYEDMGVISKEVSMWADDYVSQMAQDNAK